jgi:outer membrane murein-binding lipoprotein Lpp
MKRVFAAVAGALFLAACSQNEADARQSTDSEFTDAERAEISEIARDYILQNPEIIEEALIELQRRARARELDAYVAQIASNSDAIFDDPRDPSIGDDNAEIVIVGSPIAGSKPRLTSMATGSASCSRNTRSWARNRARRRARHWLRFARGTTSISNSTAR